MFSAGAAGGKRSGGIGLMSRERFCSAFFRSAVRICFCRLGRVDLQDIRLLFLEVDRVSFLAVGHRYQMEAVSRLDRVRDLPWLERERSGGELLDDPVGEREVADVASFFLDYSAF